MNRTHAELAALPHDVYWLYDAEDRVLYIGCTYALERRLIGHCRKVWWPRVARVEAKGFENLAAARAYEGETIRAEQPIFNRHVPALPIVLPPIIRRDEPLHAIEATA